jgi:hypothetical protein
VPPRQRKAEEIGTRGKPAETSEGRENQLVSLAIDLAEKQLRDGTASAQVISHYIKLGSSRENLEQERLRLENSLTNAKIENLASQSRMEELYVEAITAMKQYSGQKPASGGSDEDQDVF